MGVISIDDQEGAWGGSRVFIGHLLEFCIARAGERAYLRGFLDSFDDGYNWFTLEDLPADEYGEFIALVRRYLDEEAFEELGYDSNEARSSLADLLARMQRALRRRLGAGEAEHQNCSLH